jgi:ribosomal-protein-alanine N-acetyltransferase
MIMEYRSISTGTLLKTEHLILRYPQLTDAAEILAAVTSPQFPERLPLKEMSTACEIEAWLRRLQENWAAGLGFSWVAEDRGSGKLSGQVTLSRTEGEHVWALAFWIHPEDWGKGYATEGAGRVLVFGFEQLGAEKIWAGAGEWNKASCRVLEKIGMQPRGGDPQGYYSRGEPIATKVFEISRASWQTRSGE